MLAASAMAGVGLTAGAASADAGPVGTIGNPGGPGSLPAGVYPSAAACSSAGTTGVSQGRWKYWGCTSLGGGQYELWVVV
ncbi:hypothetical protein [Streptomyces sp. NPDC005573]|uniref:hypothetical protein n=1 Tax=Streptomyces sp. NPDC005573 TaxID=3156890 RepID=UPI0033AC36C7